MALQVIEQGGLASPVCQQSDSSGHALEAQRSLELDGLLKADR